MTNDQLFTLILTEAAKAGVREMQCEARPFALTLYMDRSIATRNRVVMNVKPHMPAYVHLESETISEAPPIVAKPVPTSECDFLIMQGGDGPEHGYCTTHVVKATRSAADTHWICDADESEGAKRDRAEVKPFRSRGTDVIVMGAQGARVVSIDFRFAFGEFNQTPGSPDFDFTVGESRAYQINELIFGRRPHGTSCSCYLCGLAEAGPWHEHEAASRVDYGGQCAKAAGYGLRSWLNSAMTERDSEWVSER